VQRVLGAIAVIGGWFTILIGAVAGIVASHYFGLDAVVGETPPVNVYGINAAVVVTVYLAAAVLTAAALRAWMLEPDPQPNLRFLAAGMAVAGLVLAPDDLGRAFGLPLIAGGAALWIGGELVPREVAISESAGEPSQTQEAAPAPAPAPAGGDAASLAAPAVGGSETPAPAPGSAGSPEPLGDGDASAATGRSDAKPEPPSPPVTQPGFEGPRLCPWCSREVPAAATECPNCHAALDTGAADVAPIPGLTEVPSDLRRYAEGGAGTKKRKQGLLTILFSDDTILPTRSVPPPTDASALRPPTPELKAEMARLDAEIAAGGAPSVEPARPAEPAGPAEPAEPEQGGADSEGALPSAEVTEHAADEVSGGSSSEPRRR